MIKMDNFNDESVSCTICYEYYSNDRPAIMLECSHTYCKPCLDSLLEKKQNLCSLCRKDYNLNNENTQNIFWENKTITKLLDLLNILNINIEIFLSFPLSFKYCQNCEQFITNYSFHCHELLKHKLISFNTKFKLFFFENKKDKNEILKDKNKYMIYLLYYYQSPFLPKIKYFEPLNKISFNNEKFIFYVELVKSKNESIFLNNLILKNKKDIIQGKWNKGVMINNNNKLIIHGYFHFIPHGKKLALYPIILGLLNYNANIKFFGFIKINKTIINNDEKLDINDFIFECGFLYNENKQQYYFGQFNQDNNIINFFNNTNIDNNDDENDLKK